MTARLTSDHGTTEIDDRVIVAIACRAAAETPGIGGVHGRFPGHRRGEGRPRGWTAAEGDLVSPRVRISVDYPASVREVTRRARTRIRDQVRALTGLRVGPVDIEVAALAQGRRSS
ncbi:Asp23/Gls24 family envelope stress response protein [Actinomadura rudentiformis]|uniref:Asp23/Gls24 family envelope stress response protein n=1 Tax=Actinomadura rudentiformis TaxID=359158 RepID=A0A6H9YMF5_9ACTN|nr:Asp23/Gls24 family envelope stress response protein [Actinomadura rudentiformis]KAB2347010.1 Asp23/Gls24 family envelope stress response protein [Actinomadura rudentiformis]